MLCHFDADGLAAGALFGRGLPLVGAGRVTVVPSLRDESAFSDAARDRIRALDPDALLVTDLGVSDAGTLEADGIPVLYVDHHRPSGMPEAGLVVSGYDWEPVPCSAWLAYSLLEAVVDDVDEMRELDWIAAVGVISDLGDKAPWPPLADAKRRHTAKWLKEATVLVNAARRGATFQPDVALDLLMTQDGPRDLAEAPESDTAPRRPEGGRRCDGRGAQAGADLLDPRRRRAGRRRAPRQTFASRSSRSTRRARSTRSSRSSGARACPTTP